MMELTKAKSELDFEIILKKRAEEKWESKRVELDSKKRISGSWS